MQSSPPRAGFTPRPRMTYKTTRHDLDNGRGEHWIDLNQNADVFDQPDLPGVGELGKQKDYRDGLLSDLKLNMDPQEEDINTQSQISYLGTNQRFGRKFKIVRFRWLRSNEV